MNARVGKAERRQRILRELETRPHIRVADLAALFGVSTETVRRDVEALSGEGLISRSFGVAAAAPMGSQPPFGERNRAFVEERARIGRRACGLVEPGEVLMMDAGSSTHQMAHALAATARDLVVLTNSLAVAAALGQNASIQVILCPGDLNPREAGVYGTETVDFLGRYNADKVFIGATGIGPGGITDANRSAVAIKRRMMARGRKTYLLADTSKMNREFLAEIAPLDELDVLVTDQPPEEALASALKKAGVEVVTA